MSFLPDNYKPPAETSGGYMKLTQGENRLRILGRFNDNPPGGIMGFLAWSEDGEGKRRPERFRVTVNKNGQIVVDDPSYDATKYEETPKFFWALRVWNYQGQSVQVLELTQKGILAELEVLANDPEWGDPTRYDLSITRTGEGLETRYAITPKPARDVSPEVLDADAAMTVNLDALYTGGDPFAPAAVTPVNVVAPVQPAPTAQPAPAPVQPAAAPAPAPDADSIPFDGGHPDAY